ncbi:MAG: hypothetical protein P8X55_04595 [Desulfosarcinaceae bacterium]
MWFCPPGFGYLQALKSVSQSPSSKEGTMLRKNRVGLVFFIMAAAGLMLSAGLIGCASSPPANVNSVSCEAGKIDWEVTPQAEITDFSCAMGTHALEPSLIYTVALKNISSSPQRFRLNIFLLDLNKAAGFLVPAKGKRRRRSKCLL